MQTKIKIWWTSEELRKFIPEFDEKARAYTASLPKPARPVSELVRLRQENERLKAQLSEDLPRDIPPAPALAFEDDAVAAEEPTKGEQLFSAEAKKGRQRK